MIQFCNKDPLSACVPFIKQQFLSCFFSCHGVNCKQSSLKQKTSLCWILCNPLRSQCLAQFAVYDVSFRIGVEELSGRRTAMTSEAEARSLSGSYGGLAEEDHEQMDSHKWISARKCAAKEELKVVSDKNLKCRRRRNFGVNLINRSSQCVLSSREFPQKRHFCKPKTFAWAGKAKFSWFMLKSYERWREKSGWTIYREAPSVKYLRNCLMNSR